MLLQRDLIIIQVNYLKKQIHNNQSPMHLAVLDKLPNIVYLLIYKSDLNQQDSDGNTPLHLAAKYFDREVFNCLCIRENSFDCSIKNNENKTPRNIADGIFRGHDPADKKARREAAFRRICGS